MQAVVRLFSSPKFSGSSQFPPSKPCRSGNRDPASDCPATGALLARSSRDKTGRERKSNVFCAVPQPDFLGDSLFVRFNGFRGNPDSVSDFRPVIALSNLPQHFALAVAESG